MCSCLCSGEAVFVSQVLTFANCPSERVSVCVWPCALICLCAWVIWDIVGGVYSDGNVLVGVYAHAHRCSMHTSLLSVIHRSPSFAFG